MSAELGELQQLAIGCIPRLWASKASCLCQWMSVWVGEFKVQIAFKPFLAFYFPLVLLIFSSVLGCSLSVRQGYVHSMGLHQSSLLLQTAFQSARIVWRAYQAPPWLSHFQVSLATFLDGLPVFFVAVPNQDWTSDSSHRWPSVFIYHLDHISGQFHWALVSHLPFKSSDCPSGGRSTDHSMACPSITNTPTELAGWKSESSSRQ